MAKRPKRHIAVSPMERLKLEEGKKRYEERHGPTDWGGFLGAVVWAGLAALGIYALAKVLNHSERSANLSCSHCGVQFVLALPRSSQGRHSVLLEVDCPQCGTALVVDLSKKGA